MKIEGARCANAKMAGQSRRYLAVSVEPRFHCVIAFTMFYCSTSCSAVFNIASLNNGEWSLGSPNKPWRQCQKWKSGAITVCEIHKQVSKWQAVADDNCWSSCAFVMWLSSLCFTGPVGYLGRKKNSPQPPWLVVGGDFHWVCFFSFVLFLAFRSFHLYLVSAAMACHRR